MDWSKTKTLFIITFLVLNIFLGYQLAQKRDGSQLDLLKEASIDEKLADEEITYETLPKEPKELSYISGKVKIFTEDDVKSLKNQDVNIGTVGVLKSEFQEPVKLSLTDQVKIQQFLKEHIFEGDKYTMWSVDEEAGVVVFVQKYGDYKVFGQSVNISGVIYLYLNEDKEVISYEQTFIPEFEEHEMETLITPIETLESLFNNNHLKSGSHVSKVEIGYYPLVPYSESQLLAPTWHFVIDDKTSFYVNAIEGQIIYKSE
ncbi:two-component system regulatory protein YycI [Bacillus sinesaloumensis]|uniref:two-component system regulatory protein YycI n=1 Tax=Litchfieldia sinesaloumensis TaxID=1926280 RepID=UPI0013564874|nr:two-component system regulatory protein YycI [Bacillus sinesaloumensis]